jgi:hypothetical protein
MKDRANVLPRLADRSALTDAALLELARAGDDGAVGC